MVRGCRIMLTALERTKIAEEFPGYVSRMMHHLSRGARSKSAVRAQAGLRAYGVTRCTAARVYHHEGKRGGARHLETSVLRTAWRFS